FQSEDGIRDRNVTGVQTCALPILPTAGAVLADAGAEVIKIERPTGDPMRQIIAAGMVPSAEEGYDFLFELFNRNKRGIALDIVKIGRAACRACESIRELTLSL